MPPIFLIVGAPATGKSTASRALAARFPKSVAIGVDDLRNMVIGGVVHPSAAWSDELVAQLQLARHKRAAHGQDLSRGRVRGCDRRLL